jgi:hypothetical protein
MTTADRAARAAEIGVTVAAAATGIAPAEAGWAARMLLDMVRLGSESSSSRFDMEDLVCIIVITRIVLLASPMRSLGGLPAARGQRLTAGGVTEPLELLLVVWEDERER